MKVIGNLSTGSKANVNPRACFYELDTRSPEIKKVFQKEKPEVVNHHAAFTSVRESAKKPIETNAINVLGTLNLLNQTAKHKASHFIFASTGGVWYGKKANL
ncbi:MAG: NAD-dependent epimerase/dehydratase family protein [Elusimicrobia bacterium]|nr:NAD-dependent epimerase/dehydratase family protein [Elusimicrobiota bacterium]